MQKLTLVVALLGLTLASAAVFKESEYQLLFAKWMQQYNKQYSHDTFFPRYNIFKANMDKVYLANKQNHTYTLGMNSFGDMSHDEFKTTHLGFKPTLKAAKKHAHKPVHKPHKPMASSLDWRTQGAVTPVKDQGQCGSCWAFSTTGSVEGAWKLKGNTLVSVSEQELVDCSANQGNEGCNGGLMDYAFEYIIANKGICSEASYAYKAVQGTCQSSKKTNVAHISSYTDVTASSLSAMMEAIQVGPVSVAVEADQACFQFYTSGTIGPNDGCGTQLDHGVLAVGYGTDSDGDYWIVKNSWSASWGMNGYLQIARADGDGVCGINLAASYPVV
jgi:C1A family cysteine protease